MGKASRPLSFSSGDRAVLVVTATSTYLGDEASVPTFDPSPRASVSSYSGPRHDDTITVDATDSKQWQYVDFDLGGVVAPPDTTGWDLAVRRYLVIAADAIADLGARRFEDVRDAPDRGFVANVVASARSTRRFAVVPDAADASARARGPLLRCRTRDGRFASVQVLGYYCTDCDRGLTCAIPTRCPGRGPSRVPR